MAAYSLNTATVDLSDLDTTAYGTRMKRIMEKVLEMCPELSVFKVKSDTTSGYTVQLTWRDQALLAIQVGSSGNFISSIRLYLNSAGTAYSTISGTTASSSVNLADDSVSIEIVRHGESFLNIAFVSSSDSTITTNIMFMKLSDQFQEKYKEVLFNGESQNGCYASLGSYITGSYKNGSTTDVSRYGFISADSLTPNGMYFAIPIVFRTKETADPFSGFPYGDCRLYYIYSGTTQKKFSDRLTKFTLGGKNFISLTDTICLKID